MANPQTIESSMSEQLIQRPVGRLLRRQEVEAETGLSRSTIYEQMAAERFPRPLKVGKRAVRWPSEAIEAWKRSQPVS